MSVPKSRREGYLLIDNRHAPGPDGTRFLEAATITCSHCQKQLLRSPERTRERAWCSHCDSYICDDPCAVLLKITGKCRTFKQFMEEEDQRILGMVR